MGRHEEMLSYVPLYYHTSGIFKSLLNVEGEEFDLLLQSIDDLKAQLFVETATWGLELWEKEYGIKTNLQLSNDERRSQVKGKVRGVGSVGSELIESIAEAYSNGEVSLAFNQTGVTITFIGTRGIPSALDEIMKQMKEVIPAHLTVDYRYTYLIWNEFDALSAITQESKTWDQLEVYKP